MDFDDFTGLNIEFETTQTGMGKIVLGIMLALFVAFSALTTFSFFASYASDIGQMFGAYSWIVAGTTGFLLLDVAGLMWTFVRARNASTTTQFNIATISALCTIGASVLVSFIYVLLSTTLDAGIYDGAGNLTTMGQALNIIGVFIMALAFAGNFAAIAAYVNTSATTAQAVQNTQLSAVARQGQFVANKLTVESTIKRTLNGIAQEIPQLAAKAGAQNTRQYTAAKFAGLDRNNDGLISPDELLDYLERNPDLTRRFLEGIDAPRYEATVTAAQTSPTPAHLERNDGANFQQGDGQE